MKKLEPPINQPIMINGQISQVWLIFFAEMSAAINKLNGY